MGNGSAIAELEILASQGTPRLSRKKEPQQRKSP